MLKNTLFTGALLCQLEGMQIFLSKDYERFRKSTGVVQHACLKPNRRIFILQGWVAHTVGLTLTHVAWVNQWNNFSNCAPV